MSTDRSLFVWLVDGESVMGDLARYASALQYEHYDKIDVGPLGQVAADGSGLLPVVVPVEVEFEWSGWSVDDWATTTLRVGDEQASYRLDGRA